MYCCFTLSFDPHNIAVKLSPKRHVKVFYLLLKFLLIFGSSPLNPTRPSPLSVLPTINISAVDNIQTDGHQSACSSALRNTLKPIPTTNLLQKRWCNLPKFHKFFSSVVHISYVWHTSKKMLKTGWIYLKFFSMHSDMYNTIFFYYNGMLIKFCYLYWNKGSW